ncbi:regulation of cell growth by extracellular stimulus [Halocaridina rubra]|uniref:Regulation of cell growth by extracellular stimulus n=1 Tax=Halocaridina rubra TaxID=373956 RepID=A0AAN8WT45_HALRR
MEDGGSSLLLAHAAEVRAPTVERAAHLLDAALAHRHVDEQGRFAHFVFTMNIYQYSVDTSAKGGVAGGRSRLHLMDFSALEKGKGPSRLNLSALGNVILAICNGQKHLPYK